jgi:ferrochelatase
MSKKIGILFLNLGGPATVKDVNPFLNRLFSDSDLISIPFQKYLSPWIAKRRSPAIEKQYSIIGGGSPIKYWTDLQIRSLTCSLNRKYPSVQFLPYIAFRYAHPLTEHAINEMKKDGVKDTIVFSQYPQYSCSTTGSSLNELKRQLALLDPNREINCSFITRWPTHPGLISTFTTLIKQKLTQFSENERNDVVFLFSAHSLPMSVVNRGDPYPSDVAATVHDVMKNFPLNPFRLVWQSQVGPSSWLGPNTGDSLEGLAKKNVKNAIVVPIAFTSDHIETLYELDRVYIPRARSLGMRVLRCNSLNNHPEFINTLEALISEHLESKSSNFHMDCPLCDKQSCSSTKEYFTSDVPLRVEL